MTKLFLITVGVLLLAAVVFFFLWRTSAEKRKETKATLDKVTRQLNKQIDANSRLEQTIETLRKNREDADEKIDSLHNGDSVSNAIDELSKRKS